MKPKHIVIDGRIQQTGIGRTVVRFLDNLPLLDKVNCYTVLIEPGSSYKPTAKNIKTVVCPYKNFSMNPLNQIGFSWQLYRLKPDLVYFTVTGTAPLFYFGKNVTLTHDLTMLRFSKPGKYPIVLHWLRMLGYKLLFWKGNVFADHIITPTDFVKKDLSEKYSSTSEKITRVYEAGDLPPKIKAEKPSQISKPFIFHAGSPLPHKNIKNLVLAFRKLKKTHPKLKLVLAGKKEQYFEKLETWLDEEKLSKDIVITGYVKDAELKWLYENAEMYVLPSLSEGFGLPGLEAMSYGCPLVSSDATCLPEVYGNGTEYFDPNNVDDMIRAINVLLEDKKYAQSLVAKGKKQVAKYSFKKMSEEILAVLNSQLMR